MYLPMVWSLGPYQARQQPEQGKNAQKLDHRLVDDDHRCPAPFGWQGKGQRQHHKRVAGREGKDQRPRLPGIETHGPADQKAQPDTDDQKSDENRRGTQEQWH